ncbi:tripartite tricarboxylate transporter substrate-binding protein [Achromobacter sp. F4_2707]|uniref:Bug family tripartite tricarboxylate transporter substrate binding protein n=1 Tax=Achromobacter sp. F4_2707 TaxID=3114286 RepID=UPI0039C6E91B
MRSSLKKITLAVTTLLFAGSAIAADNYPSKPVRIIVPYQAGQGTDIATRYFADHLSKVFGQSFIVENVGGAGGVIGTQAAARAEGDGYTLTMGTNATHVLNEYMYSSMGFNPVKDFEPVILTGTLPMAIVTRPDSQFKTVQDIIDATNKSDHSADIATPSTSARLVFELLKAQSGAPLFMIPYKGSATSMSNVIGGQVPLSIDTITASRPQVEGGNLRAIGVTSANPTDLLPGVAPVSQQGLPGFEVVAWNALYAPKGTPQNIIAKLNLELQAFLSQPDTQAKLHSMGYEPGGGTPGDLAAFAQAERDKWRPIIESADLKVN